MSKADPRLSWTVYSGSVYGFKKRPRRLPWEGIVLLVVWVVLLAGLVWVLK